MVLLDTNVPIEILKNNQDAIEKTASLAAPLAVSAVTAMELMVGARNKKETRLLNQFVSRFQLIPLDAEISKIAYQLIIDYAKSHALDIPDALISATAISRKARLLTYNIKDFAYIPSLELVA